MEFRVGDRVKIEGVIVENASSSHPFLVKFDGWEESFTKDGRYTSHNEPTLQLVERPKRKVKKQVERWANIYSDGYVTAHHSEPAANHAYIKNQDEQKRIACIKLTGEYEVEE